MANRVNPTSFLGALGGKYPDTSVLFSDTFTDGFDGWTELYESGTNTPRPALSRVSFPAMSGPYALRLGTGAVGNASKDGSASAYKRLTRPMTETGLDTAIVNYECWWSWGATLAILAPQQIEFGIDSQAWDGSLRHYYKLRWQLRDTSTGAQVGDWEIMNDAGALVAIPNSTYIHPFNENKQNYNYMRLRVDLVNGYQNAWINGRKYDLTGLGAGNGNTATVTNFNGGLNFGVTVTNRGASQLCQAWVDVDQTRGWVEGV